MQKWLQNKDQIDLTDLLVILVFSSIPDVPDVPSLLFIHMPPYTTNGKHYVQTPRIALQWTPKWRLLSRSFSCLTLRNNYCMRVISLEEIY